MATKRKRSPSAVSTDYMKERGYHVEVVERFIPGANIRKDLLGFGDLLCFKVAHKMAGERLVLVQTTSKSNMKARVDKVLSSPLLSLALEHFRIEVHGVTPDGKVHVHAIL